MAEREPYDVVVLGGGTAGSNAAHEAHVLGRKVAMVYDENRWQNLCIELGCMPSKSLLDAVHLGLSYEKALQRKDEHIRSFLSHLRSSQEEMGYDIVRGRAAFNERVELVVQTENGERILAGERYVVATGSDNFVPPIEGLSDAPHFTSDEVVRNKVTPLPGRLAVIGGGPIGLELATFFAGMGSEVTVVERGMLLAPFDPEFGVEMKAALEARGISVLEFASVERVAREEEGTKLAVRVGEGVQEVAADNVLVATGRRPRTEGLGLERLGLHIEKGQLVKCSATMCTDNERVYAAGDITRDIELLHVAAEEGRVAGRNAAGAEPKERVDYERLRTSVIFSEPTVAHVGLSEKDARGQGVDVATSLTRLPDTGRATTMGVRFGLWKMIADKRSGQIVGSTILGPRADDLIHEVYLAKQFGHSVGELAELAGHFGGYHPTLSEQFFNLTENIAAQLQQ